MARRRVGECGRSADGNLGRVLVEGFAHSRMDVLAWLSRAVGMGTQRRAGVGVGVAGDDRESSIWTGRGPGEWTDRNNKALSVILRAASLGIAAQQALMIVWGTRNRFSPLSTSPHNPICTCPLSHSLFIPHHISGIC